MATVVPGNVLSRVERALDGGLKFPDILFHEIKLPAFLSKVQARIVAGIAILASLAGLAGYASTFKFSEDENIIQHAGQVYGEQALRVSRVGDLDISISKLAMSRDEAIRTGKPLMVIQGKTRALLEVVLDRDREADQYNLISEVSKFRFSQSEFLPSGEKITLPFKLKVHSNDEIKKLVDFRYLSD